MMILEKGEKRKELLLLLGLDTLSKKKEGKIARLKNYIKSSYRSLLLLLLS
jgi:hypothetical protein